MSPPGADKPKIVRDHITLSGLPCAKHGCLFSLFQGYFRVSEQGSLRVLVTILFCSHREMSARVGIVCRDSLQDLHRSLETHCCIAAQDLANLSLL